jgi:hypothetical protein
LPYIFIGMKENGILVAVNLGCFKAYMLDYEHVTGSRPRVDLIESFLTEVHQPLRELKSDEPGQFRGNPASKEVRARGEEHDLILELDRRAIAQFAQRINQLIKEHNECSYWHLAAPKRVHHPLFERIDPDVKIKLKAELPKDLTKMSESALVDYVERMESEMAEEAKVVER